MPKKWISGAIKHPGALTRSAKRAGAISKSGKIQLGKMSRIAKRTGNTTMKRRIALARTLRKMHH